jgi:hypothetical protein
MLIAADGEHAVSAITIAELGVGVEAATGKRRKARRASSKMSLARCQSSVMTVRSLEHIRSF